MTLVIDASAAMKWLVDGEGSDRARALIGTDRLVAPELIMTEAANALWRYSSAGMLSVAAGEAALGALSRILDQTYSMSALSTDAYGLACSLGHPVYDCCYLALAGQVKGTVVTADRRLIAKVAGTPWQDKVRPL